MIIRALLSALQMGFVANLRVRAQSAAGDAVFSVVMALMILTGAGFLLASAFGALTRVVPGDVAAAIVGGVLIVIPLIGIAIRNTKRRRKIVLVAEPATEPTRADGAQMVSLGLTAAFVGGFVAARSILRRK